MQNKNGAKQPNVLFIMTDQQRFDTICALGNSDIHTPNLDRLVARGAAFTNAYSTTPVCTPARYTISTGCELPTIGDERMWARHHTEPLRLHREIEERCGPYLATKMSELGYRTFGVGKFDTVPWDAPIGFDVQLHSRELHTADDRSHDDYIAWLEKEHPEYSWIESLHGERTEMYYMPQRSPLPAELTVEAWAADHAIELINVEDDRPWFGFVSFIGPHPPFAPPQPYNRIYDPDRMPNPIYGDRTVDHMDQYLPIMNHMTWADDITDSHARVLKARYYGEITYIDHCIGRILDTIEVREDAANTLICFYADHGEHLGDHRAWQKESFFEPSARIPFLVSWPSRIPVGKRSELACLTDLFGIATSAAGKPELREGADILGLLTDNLSSRSTLYGYYGEPGSWLFKIMVRRDRWKMIYLANGGLTQLFDVETDPHELNELSDSHPDIVASLLDAGARELGRRGWAAALDNTGLRRIPFQSCQQVLGSTEQMKELFPIPVTSRIHQFDPFDRITCFPQHPSDVLDKLT